MKKLLLTTIFTIISCFSFSQNWKEVQNTNGLLIESTNTEFHDETNDIHQENLIIKLTNTSLLPRSFTYSIEVTYGDNSMNYYEDGFIELTLGVGESVTVEPILVRFLPNRDGKVFSQSKLTNFNIIIQ